MRPAATLAAGTSPRPAPQGTKLWPMLNWRPIAVSSRRVAACWADAGPESAHAPAPSRAGAAAGSGADGLVALAERVRAPIRASTRPTAVRLVRRHDLPEGAGWSPRS